MTNDMPVPERVGAKANPNPIVERSPDQVAEPSMFDSAEWTDGLSQGAATEVKFAGVRFQRVGKIYHYLANALKVKVGDWVIVDTARGSQMGQVATLKPPRDKANLSAFKNIERLATGRDMAMRHFHENKELEAMIACRAESNALALPIKIVKAEYSFDGQTLTFLYSSDQEERVETNELRQVMSRLYRARIETRQVSPREVAKIIGGMGACGIEERCCSRFLTEFSPISIKHAKEQGLSLNPHDITGMCGRLRCCLIYEYEQYVEARRKLPKKNSIVGTPSGQGKVVDLLPMRDSVVVLIGEAEAAKEIVVHREQIVPLEELKRLQDKAASGTCDKHEGGGCDCGKGKPADAAAQNASEAVASPDQPPAPPAAAAEAAGERPSGDSRNRRERKPSSSGRPVAGSAADARPPEVRKVREAHGNARNETPHGAAPHKRHPLRPKRTHTERAGFPGERRIEPSGEPFESPGPGGMSQPEDNSPASNSNAEPKAIRRPLRRPIPRKAP